MSELNEIAGFREKIMDGVLLEEPQFLFRWGMTEEEFMKSFPGEIFKVRRSAAGVSGTMFGGLYIRIGLGFTNFEFNKKKINNGLFKVSIGLNFKKYTKENVPSTDTSYALFQDKLVSLFGKPDHKGSNVELPEYPTYLWELSNDIKIKHAVPVRFGPEEYVAFAVKDFHLNW